MKKINIVKEMMMFLELYYYVLLGSLLLISIDYVNGVDFNLRNLTHMPLFISITFYVTSHLIGWPNINFSKQDERRKARKRRR